MSEVSQLERQREGSLALIAERDLALKLSDNPDFKKLILEEFCVRECARYAQSSGDPALTAEQRADALALSQAAGHLRRWLSVKVRMGNQAEGQLPELEAAIEEARQEGGEE
jgi:hypothetical protein